MCVAGWDTRGREFNKLSGVQQDINRFFACAVTALDEDCFGASIDELPGRVTDLVHCFYGAVGEC